MPGLAGIISDKSESTLFSRMVESLNHYDYTVEKHENEGVHLGRIHLNYVNTFPQPVFSADRRYGLIMIGEIFSYDRMEADDIKSDSELLLHILIHDGLDSLSKVNGHFSAAWYDFYDKKLILISDRFGTRPLYYSLNRGRLLFAAEVKAILEDNWTKSIDYNAVSHLFHFTHLFGHRTLFSGISQLPEASFLVFHKGKIQIKKYWDYPYDEKAYTKEKVKSSVEDKFIDELDHRMQLAMKRVMTKNADDLLISLSGGLDSRYVAAYANFFEIKNLASFTFGPPDCDDQRFSKLVAEQLHLNHHPFEVIPDDIWKHAGLFAYYSDYMGVIYGPVQGFGALLEYFRKKEVTISSQMADAIFGGNLWRRKLQYLMGLDSFNAEAKDIVINIFNLVDENLLKELFADDFYKQIKDGYKEVPDNYINEYKYPLHTYINLLMNEHGRRGTLCGNLMNNLFLETRMPSYDNELMDFAYRLPLRLRFNQFAYRKVFTRNFPDLARIKRERYNLRIDSPDICYDLRILENKVINTLKKTSLKPALSLIDKWNRPTYIDHNRWFKNDLKQELIKLLTDQKATSRGIYKKGGIEKIISAHQHEMTDHSRLLWQIVNLELFIRRYFD